MVSMELIDERLIQAAIRAGIGTHDTVIVEAPDPSRAKDSAIAKFRDRLNAHRIPSSGRIDVHSVHELYEIRKRRP
jgi:hypothetical protein